jgi:protein disulfide-isomerase A6
LFIIDLEDVLDIGGFGYPALTVISTKKMKLSTLTGSFGFEGIQVK